MRVTTHHSFHHNLHLDDGSKAALQHDPNYDGDVLAEIVGDKLVVAYLVQDSDPHNPLRDNDAEGNIYTRGERVITDDEAEICYALGVDRYGNPDIDKEFDCEPRMGWSGTQVRVTTLRDLAAEAHLTKVSEDLDLIERWFEGSDLALAEGQTYSEAFTEHHKAIWHDLLVPNGWFCEEVEALAISLYPQYWQQIAGPYVVVMHYNGGSYDTSISPSEWDGDPDDLPNCIWVADKLAIENVLSSAYAGQHEGVDIHWAGHTGAQGSTLHAVVSKGGEQVFDAGVESGSWGRALAFISTTYGPANDTNLRAVAEKYATGVAENYAAWCSGDCYGCVTEVFQREGEGDDAVWEQTSEDACWGFIGGDYARQTLKDEYFDNVVEKLKASQQPRVLVLAADDTEGGAID